MNKLARYIIIACVCAIVCFLAWYFRSVLIYIVLAAVVALIGKPMTTWLKGLHYRKLKMPSWLAAILTLTTIVVVFFSLFMLLAPIIGQIVHNLGHINLEEVGANISEPLAKYNVLLHKFVPSLDESFRIEMYAMQQFRDAFSISMVSGFINSLTAIIANFGVAVFSIIFIAFFFLMEEGMFTNTIVAVAPDKYEENIRRASASISNLLTRYFLGITIESLGITLLNTIGLVFIAKMDFSLAIVIAFLSGILNVIPYVGPIIGDAIAVLMGLVTHYSSGFNSALGIYLLVILAIFIVTQLIDNYVFQPLIYSSSVKAHPLEIFIVILLAGHIGGIVGMLIAIPCYTVIRVIAGEFLSKFKLVQKLTRSIKNEEPELTDSSE